MLSLGQVEEVASHAASPRFLSGISAGKRCHRRLCCLHFSPIWAGVSQFPRMLRAVHWHQKWGIVVKWLWKRLSVHWAPGSSFKHELPGNLRVHECLNGTALMLIIGGFKLDKGRLSCCSCPLMLFRTHNETEEESEGRRAEQNEEDVVHNVEPLEYMNLQLIYGQHNGNTVDLFLKRWMSQIWAFRVESAPAGVVR